MATMSGSGLRLVISHPDAAAYIQLPTLASTVAVHSNVNVAWRNGLKGERAGGTEGGAGGEGASGCDWLIAQRCLMKVPSRSSATAASSSACVFITIGPYQATGSSIGLP